MGCGFTLGNNYATNYNKYKFDAFYCNLTKEEGRVVLFTLVETISLLFNSIGVHLCVAYKQPFFRNKISFCYCPVVTVNMVDSSENIAFFLSNVPYNC